ncbi:MAG: LysM peptidoglycan-binding domain-containing protein [Polyangiaceae bacterium]
MRRTPLTTSHSFVALVLAVLVPLTVATPRDAAAQNAPAAPAAAPAQPATVVPVFPGPVASPPPGQALGGGSLDSSSRPKLPGESDSFDLGQGSGSGGTVFGNDKGPVFLPGDRSTVRIGGVAPDVHIVQRGDTLWDLCDRYFQNPYQWPRIWSYNPQIQNPHWIYPGDAVRFRGNRVAQGTGGGVAPASASNIIDRRRQVAPDTLFLRDQGFIDDQADENWGEINGSPEDKMFLTDTDDVYLRLDVSRDVRIGQELTVFRYARSVPGGKLVQLQGTVRINDWNPKTGIARASVVETLDAIERGARVGPVGRRFTIVPPLRNETDVEATVLASLYPHVFYGQNQLVFIDKGEKDGVHPGNRLLITRREDAWGKSLAAPNAATRIAIESTSPAAIEKVPTPRNNRVLPEESVADLRVVFVRDHTAACVVTNSDREIEPGDIAKMRKGL